VWPKFEKVTLRQVDLKILQRHARSLGAQVGLVTRVRGIRADAKELGMPVFESTAEAQRAPWGEIPLAKFPRRAPAGNLREGREQVQMKEEAWRSHPLTRVASLTLGVVAVLAIVALFIPRAQIKLNPISQTQRIVLPVVASPDTTSVNITGTIPAREKRIILDGTQTVTVTGETVIPQATSQGVVEFRNLTQAAVTIPAGTVVTANEIQFTTTEEIIVAAGVGKKIEVPIEAVVGGLAGNVDVEAINAVEGRLGLSVSVTNLEPTTGGRELASVQASDADRARAKELLLVFLNDEARAEFINDVDSDDVLFEDTISISQILLEEYDPPPGAAGTLVTLTMQVEFSARYASASDLSELASLALNASAPLGFSPASESLTISRVTEPEIHNDGSANWRLRVEREIIQIVDASRVIQLVVGRGLGSARSALESNLPLENSPQIQMIPSWWQWLPMLPFRIEVITE
jgi:hypothetical protein